MEKYKFKILIITLITVFCGACDYLDVVPDNVATIDNAFSNKASAEKFLHTCYSYQPEYGDWYWDPAMTSGDEIWLSEENWDGNIPAVLIAKGFQNANNPLVNYWDGNRYVALRDCNIFLSEIEKVPDMSTMEKKRWIAEVKFLKAYYHFVLFRAYGPIPVIRENLPIYVETKDVTVYREPVDDVVDYMVQLLDEAASDLPDRIAALTQEYGRITKPTALTLKAKILLTAASPLFNGNSDYSTLVDNRGTQLFNPVYDPAKWQKAADAAKEAIDVCEAAGIRLYDDYDPKEDNYSEAVLRELTFRSVVTEKGSSEIIWPGTNNRQEWWEQGEYQPLLVQVTSSNPVRQRIGATMRMAELFYSKNGVPIDEDREFSYEDRYKLRVAESSESDFVRSGESTAILHYDREPRFYASISFDRGAFILDPTYYYVGVRAGELATKRNKGEYSVTGYFVKKLINPLNAFSGESYGIDYAFPWPILRLADLYLMYAEALNEVKSAPDAEVYEYIDLIRERAGLQGVVESWANHSINPEKPSTQNGMREIIRQERMIELAFEGHRFYDVRRWKIAAELMNKPIKGWNIKGAGLEFYNVTTIYSPRFEFKDYFWPIRESELINNPNLVQNLGW